MASTMPCGPRPQPDPRHGLGGRARAAWGRSALLGWLLAWGLLFTLPWARADDEALLTLERATDGVYLSARVPLTLPAELEDVMLRGVPLHFVWQVDWRRTRWYWADLRLGNASRVVRVAYQPLTRRWRVSTGVGPLNEQGLASALHQNLATLDEALAAVSRVTRWRVLSAADLAEAVPDKIDVQFRLDAGLLPRLFQIGQLPGGEPSLTLRRTLDMPEPGSAVTTPEGGAHHPREGT